MAIPDQEFKRIVDTIEKTVEETIREELKNSPRSVASADAIDLDDFKEELLKEVREITDAKRLHLFYHMQVLLDYKLGELLKAIHDPTYVPEFVSDPMTGVPRHVLARSRGEPPQPQKEAFCPGCGHQYTNQTDDVCPGCNRQRQLLAGTPNGTSTGQQQAQSPASQPADW